MFNIFRFLKSAKNIIKASPEKFIIPSGILILAEYQLNMSELSI